MDVGRRIDEAEWQRWSRPVCPRMHLVVALAGNLPLPLWLPGDTRQQHHSSLPAQVGTWAGPVGSGCGVLSARGRYGAVVGPWWTEEQGSSSAGHLADDERTDGERQEKLEWKGAKSSHLWPRCRREWSHILDQDEDRVQDRRRARRSRVGVCEAGGETAAAKSCGISDISQGEREEKGGMECWTR